MAETEKKRRSGRSRDESSETAEPGPKKKKKAESAATEPDEKLNSPWGPLIWLLIPLFACVAYGLATRGN